MSLNLFTDQMFQSLLPVCFPIHKFLYYRVVQHFRINIMETLIFMWKCMTVYQKICQYQMNSPFNHSLLKNITRNKCDYCIF